MILPFRHLDTNESLQSSHSSKVKKAEIFVLQEQLYLRNWTIHNVTFLFDLSVTERQ